MIYVHNSLIETGSLIYNTNGRFVNLLSMRPYVNLETFRYPQIGPLSANENQWSNRLDNFHIDELVSAHSQISAVGTSVVKFYFQMVFSQPLKVSRFLAQVGDWSENTINEPKFDEIENNDDEEIDYFIDTSMPTASAASIPSEAVNSPEIPITQEIQIYEYKPNKNCAIDMSNGPYILSTASSITKKEGPFGLWRAMNSSCLCKAATGVLGAWITSFLASICSVPDPQFVDLLHTLEPVKVAAIGVAGCALTTYLLTPLFVIRARLIVTSMLHPDKPRSLRWSLLDMARQNRFLSPITVAAPAMLAASIETLASLCLPLLCWKYAEIDAFSSPNMYNFINLLSEITILGIKLPLETLASRAQLHEANVSPESTIVTVYPYRGVWFTFWEILSRKQSLSSLYRGWRSELVGVVGEWGYNALEERKHDQERF